VDVGPDGKGSVEVDKKAFTVYPGTLDIQSGTSVHLEAVPAPGYQFSNWSGSLSGNQNPATIKVDCTKNITAYFTRIVHTLMIDVNGKGSVEADKKALSSYPDTLNLQSGTSVHLEAVPALGYQFTNWGGSLSGSRNPATMVIDNNSQITAHFSQTVHTLTVHIEGNGATTPLAGEHTYADGAVVNVTAIPDKGWQFDGWIGNVAVPISTSSTATIESDMTITAQFSQVKPDWWLISSIIGGVIVVGTIIWLVLRNRAI